METYTALRCPLLHTMPYSTKVKSHFAHSSCVLTTVIIMVSLLYQQLKKTIKIVVFITIFYVLFMAFFHTTTTKLELVQVQQKQNSPRTLAEELYNDVRILCMVITAPQNHDSRAVHILRTWGRHCNLLLFISTAEHGELEPLVVNVKEGHDEVWLKVQKGLGLAYEYHGHEVDWFLKVEDDNFVVLENLRYFLRRYAPESAIYFGTKSIDKNSIETKAGYVLSKEAVRRFLSPKVLPVPHRQRDEEKVAMERWLQSVGVSPGNTKLNDGDTFFSYPAYIPRNMTNLEENTNSSDSWWSLEEFSKRPSKHAIAFHNVKPAAMYNLEYLIYNLRLFGKTTFK